MRKFSSIFSKALCRQAAFLIVLAFSLASCDSIQFVTPSTLPIRTRTPSPSATFEQSSTSFDPADYAFPSSIDQEREYMFYVHGKIIEDQGIPAVSPEYGEYEYLKILETLRSHGFVVISEVRTQNTNAGEYARRVSEQITSLMVAGVPAENITVVGASKGAAIAIEISNLLKDENTNFVIMGICHPDVVKDFKQTQTQLFGNVLSIYDSVDEWAGSCQELFALSEGKGLTRYEEIVLEIGTGHGILYQALDEWVIPTIEWARAHN